MLKQQVSYKRFKQVVNDDVYDVADDVQTY